MYSEIKLISKVKAQITKFTHKVSRSFKKPKGKFIHQMIYGIQAAKDVKLLSSSPKGAAQFLFKKHLFNLLLSIEIISFLLHHKTMIEDPYLFLEGANFKWELIFPLFSN